MPASASFLKNAKFLKILISDREIPVKNTSFSRFPYKSINFCKGREIFVIFNITGIHLKLKHYVKS